MNDVIHVVYRCDNAYKYFLYNSIHSVLKFYKGKRILKFDICTTEEAFDVQRIDSLKTKYTFEYEIIVFNAAYIANHEIVKPIQHLLTKKYGNLVYETRETDKHSITLKNNDLYVFDPFARCKISTICNFLHGWSAFNERQIEKAVVLDTDTIVLHCIDSLYDHDIPIVGFAREWTDTNIFSPAVGVYNLKEICKTDIFVDYIKGLQRVFEQKDTTAPFNRLSQLIFYNAVRDNWTELDPSWNVPVTHMHQYADKKILHFSESWSGKQYIFDMYNTIVDKYLSEE